MQPRFYWPLNISIPWAMYIESININITVLNLKMCSSIQRDMLNLLTSDSAATMTVWARPISLQARLNICLLRYLGREGLTSVGLLIGGRLAIFSIKWWLASLPSLYKTKGSRRSKIKFAMRNHLCITSPTPSSGTCSPSYSKRTQKIGWAQRELTK